MAWDDLDEQHYRWGEVADIRAYRAEVKALVVELIKTLPMTLPINQTSTWWVILMGIEHERIHIETSSVLHRQMPLEFIQSVPIFKACEVLSKATTNELIQMQGESITLGKATSSLTRTLSISPIQRH